jgi:tetratricopeptide (TPR) repeat protein
VLVVLLLTGLFRPLAALPFVNLGTTALYRATLRDDLGRASRAWALSWAVPTLQTAVTIDPDGIAARRNLALALAAGGDRAGARRLADEARARIDAANRDALFGIGRVYLAADAWDLAIDAWAEAGAGARLLRLGRQLAEGDAWRTGVRTLVAAAQVGAPGRSAPDAITSAALAHGRTTEEAIEELMPLVDTGGTVEYHARLQIAHVYRQAGHLDLAEMALAWAGLVGHDEQHELEQALILAARGELARAEERLRWALDHPVEPPQALPDGDDPHYWLALVQARQGRHADAVRTARAGLAALPDQQASLRVPYALLVGESLLALGQPAEAEAAFRAGQRNAPDDARLADGIARARAARR